MATLKVLDASGKAKGEVKLAETLSAGDAESSLLHRAVLSEQANRRQGTQSTLTRSEVRGGGRKPYRQKKTGRARQGSIRAPHYVHGGVTHAPKPRSYAQKLNRKERRSAILIAFGARVQAGDVVVVEAITFESPKTKAASALLANLAGGAKRVLVIIPAYDETVIKSFRNLRNGKEQRVEVRTAPSSAKEAELVKTQAFSARDLLVAHKIVIAKDALKAIEEVWA